MKWVMGHSLGIDDVYSFRDAAETAETMRRVEAYVFGEPDEQRKDGRSFARVGLAAPYPLSEE